MPDNWQHKRRRGQPYEKGRQRQLTRYQIRRLDRIGWLLKTLAEQGATLGDVFARLAEATQKVYDTRSSFYQTRGPQS